MASYYGRSKFESERQANHDFINVEALGSRNVLSNSVHNKITYS
jgi:hypothetical protein